LISPIFPEISRCRRKGENGEYGEFDILLGEFKENMRNYVYREEKKRYSPYSPYSPYFAYR